VHRVSVGGINQLKHTFENTWRLVNFFSVLVYLGVVGLKIFFVCLFDRHVPLIGG
jgi:hypothetical protein